MLFFRLCSIFFWLCLFTYGANVSAVHADEQRRLVVVTEAGDEFYFLPPTLKRSGDEVSVDVLMNYGHPDPFNGSWSSIQVTLFDCKSGNFQVLQDKFFSKKMGKGKIVQASDWPMPSFPAPQGSSWHMVLMLVCQLSD